MANQSLSDEPHGKLQAVLNHDWNDPDANFPVEYLQACAKWFTGLSDLDRAIAKSAVWVYAGGDETSAAQIAADLPAAPRCPFRSE